MVTTHYISSVISMMILIVFFGSSVWADPDKLQDICPADTSSNITINGYPCKPQDQVSANDFFSAGLKYPRPTNNFYGSTITRLTPNNLTGMNTQGVSISRVDFAPNGGLNPPHYHPRATEVSFCLKGRLNVSFITTDYKLYNKIVNSGEVFIFPQGLIHFQQNIGKQPAATISFFNSQSPGAPRVATALFTSTPSVSNEVLGKTFGNIEPNIVEGIRMMLAATT